LQIKAIKLQPNNPFTWLQAGSRQFIAITHYAFISNHSYVYQAAAYYYYQEKFGSVGCIAGVATAGIPQGALVAQELGLPFIYVRAKPKEHGTGNLIEGDVLTVNV